ncbi:unnamed protein product [Haemonchus placei]|uniref:RING-type domain-containing protein n=1 Tax=Haemonchus placei TaxID=6290 RepID=A0A0N4X0V0_HAEPC|nr:unnamed protein product [Haemonchus placei]
MQTTTAPRVPPVQTGSAMLRNLVRSLRSRARSADSKTPTKTVRDTDEPPILDTIQRMVDKCMAEQNDEQEPSCSDDTCCVCMSRVATVHAYPCGHKISCRLCATMMLKPEAPFMLHYAQQRERGYCRSANSSPSPNSSLTT